MRMQAAAAEVQRSACSGAFCLRYTLSLNALAAVGSGAHGALLG